MAEKPKKQAKIATQRQLAELVDRNEAQVGRWCKRKDWVFGSAPWAASQLPAILRWMAETLKETSTDSADDDTDVKALRKRKLQQEIRKLTAQAETFETALARERGSLIEAAEVERTWANVGSVVRNGFQSLSSQLVPLALSHGMPHEAAPIFQQQVSETVAAILRRLSTDVRDEDDDGSDEAVSTELVSAGAMDAQ